MANTTSGKAATRLYPVRHYVKVMLLISFSVLVLDLAISIASIFIVKQQSTRYLQDTADLYINRINHDFDYINHYMGWTLANDETLNTMNAYRINSIEFLKANENLHKRFTELQKNYGQEYNFFYYLKNQSYFLNCAPISVTYTDYRELKKQIISFIDDKELYEKFYSKWTPVLVNGKYYVINIVPYYNRYLIGLISADHLIRPLRQINLGANGYASPEMSAASALPARSPTAAKCFRTIMAFSIGFSPVPRSAVSSRVQRSAPRWSLNSEHLRKS